MKPIKLTCGLALLATIGGCNNGEIPALQSAVFQPTAAATSMAQMETDPERPEAPLSDVEPVEPLHHEPVVSEPDSGVTAAASQSHHELEGITRPTEIGGLSPIVAGLIDTVHVREGQRVRKGAKLVSLDAGTAAARLAAADVDAKNTGRIRRAEVTLRVAEQYLRRLNQAPANAVRAVDLEESVGRRDEAAASLQEERERIKTAMAARDIAAAQVREYTVFAPFNGVIVEIHQRSGIADPTSPLVKIANLDRLEVAMHIPADRLGSVQAGDTVQLTAAAPVSKRLTATVVSASPLIDSASNTFRCLLEIDNTDGTLPAGFTVRLDK